MYIQTVIVVNKNSIVYAFLVWVQKIYVLYIVQLLQ